MPFVLTASLLKGTKPKALAVVDSSGDDEDDDEHLTDEERGK